MGLGLITDVTIHQKSKTLFLVSIDCGGGHRHAAAAMFILSLVTKWWTLRDRSALDTDRVPSMVYS